MPRKRDEEGERGAAPSAEAVSTDPNDRASTIPIPELGTAGIEEPLPPLVSDEPTPSGASTEEPPVYTPPAEPTAPRRRKSYGPRGPRKPKEAAAPAVAPGPKPEDVAALSAAFAVAFDVAGKIVAAKRGAHWQLAPDESKMLGSVWAVAFAPYMEAAGKYVPFIVAGLATVGVVMPRIEADARAVASLQAPRRPAADDNGAIPIAIERRTQANVAADLQAMRDAGIEP